MGHVRVKIRIANPSRRQEADAVDDALVDNGATFTTIPRAIAEQLGLEVLGQQMTRTATGDVRIDRSFAYQEIAGHDAVLPIWISDTHPGVLVGVFTLEGMALAVDPKSGRVVDSELLLL